MIVLTTASLTDRLTKVGLSNSLTAYASLGTDFIDPSMSCCSDSDDETDIDDFGTDHRDDGTTKGILSDLWKRMSCTTMSTAFSGIDTPGTSFQQLYVSLEMMLFGKVSNHGFQHHLHATEWYGPSQQELLNHPQQPKCLFGNIEDFLSPILRNQLLDFVASDRLDMFTQVLLENPNAIQT